MLLEKIRLRRTVADKVSESEGIGFRAALRLVDNINSKATPDQLAAASDDLPAGSFAGGLLDEQSIHAVCCASGVADACPQAQAAGRLFHRAASRIRSAVSACPTLSLRVQRSVETVQACPSAVTRTFMVPQTVQVEKTVLVPETKMVEKTVKVPVTTMVEKKMMVNQTTFVPKTETVLINQPPAKKTQRSITLNRTIERR